MANVGGQAVLEGVMMRGPGNWAVAVRTPSGTIEHVSRPIDSAQAQALGLPPARHPRRARARRVARDRLPRARDLRELRGAGSADAEGDERQRRVETELSRGALFFAFAVAIGFAILLFKVTPVVITDLLPIKSTGWFVLVEGAIRVTIFVAYLTLISLLPDLRRVFQYHAAEHKAINAYEAGEPLEPEIVQRYSLIHPRCGTAFLLWVMVIADLRLRVLRPARLVLADRDAHPAAAR